MDRTFGVQLLQFAQSVDHVDDVTFKRLGKQVKRYGAERLDADYIEFKVEATVNELPGLRKEWTTDETEGQDSGTLLTDPDDPTSYRNQTSFAFDRDKKLWIVGVDEEPLYGEAGFVEMWFPGDDSVMDQLPKYQRPGDRDLRTSIIVPVKWGGRTRGVINLESAKYVESNQLAKGELLRLAGAIGLLAYARDTTRQQSSSTSSALDRLDDRLGEADLQPLTKPRIFVASAEKAEEDVVAAISLVLDRFSTHVEAVWWNSLAKPGSITEDLIREIRQARFGLCYLSTPDPGGGDRRYRHNLNVIFEAGMMHAADPKGWIPVREFDSPHAPFDFQHQRAVTVVRDDQGTLDEAAFTEDLGTILLAMLNEGD